MGGNWLDIDGTAVHFGVSQKTVRRWIAKREQLGFVAEMRRGAWTVDIDTVNHAAPVGATPQQAAQIADLERQLAAEKRRADTALVEVGRVAGRLEEQTKLLTWHTGQEEEARRRAEEAEAELAKIKRRGWLARLLNTDFD